MESVGSSERGARVQHAAVRALTANLIDYAGLFPPAGLDMPTTVANYAAYLADPDAWMLERLIVPVARLDEFESAAEALLPRGDEEEPWPISALTAPAGDAGLEADVDRIARFNARHRAPAAGAAVIDVIELRASTPGAIDLALDLVPEELFAFFELPVADDPRGLVAALGGADAGAKVRTGGVRADLYPETAHVARFIAACAAAEVPFKATAGLHHPLPHRSAEPEVVELGFINVFVAAALALYRDLPAPEIERVLRTEEAGAFAFDEGGVSFEEHRLSVDEIEDSRLTFAVSFGSCSFDEPREGLRALGLLPPAAGDDEGS